MGSHVVTLMHHLAWFVALFLCASCTTTIAPPPPSTPHSVTRPSHLPKRLSIPLRQHNGFLGGLVTINNTPSGYFMIDTGSTENVVSPLVANQLDLPPGIAGMLNGIAGQEAMESRPVHQMALGGLGLLCKQVAVLDLYRFNDSFRGIVNGIIGFPAFGRVPFTIDYQASQLTLYRPNQFNPEPDAVAHRLWPYRGLPVVRATIGQGHEILLIVDSGAETHITLPLECAERWPDIVLVPVTSRGNAKGIGGSVPTVQTWLKSINLFGLNLYGVPVSFESRLPSRRTPNVLMGRIGNRLLKDFRLTFDPAKGRVWSQWRGGR